NRHRYQYTYYTHLLSYTVVHHHHIHSFPTRRSSDLAPPGAPSGTFFQATVLTYTVLGLVGGGGVLGSIYLYRVREAMMHRPPSQDRKSTRLNSSHRTISYAVFCLKKKKSLSTSIELT